METMKNMYSYDANETMKFIGKQYFARIIGDDTFRQLDDILDAHFMDSSARMAVLDAYALGFIYGKRNERAKGKK